MTDEKKTKKEKRKKERKQRPDARPKRMTGNDFIFQKALQNFKT